MSRTSAPLAALLCAAAIAGLASTAMASTTPDGKAIYEKSCSSCHQATGEGLAGTFPPLAKNEFVTGDTTKLLDVVLHGKNGKSEVNGKTYNGSMPAWKGQLTNAEIAAVLTYVRSSWGNSASKITESQVQAAAK
jgi:cbb3-type cytochrome c oxidase subunit III